MPCKKSAPMKKSRAVSTRMQMLMSVSMSLKVTLKMKSTKLTRIKMNSKLPVKQKTHKKEIILQTKKTWWVKICMAKRQKTKKELRMIRIRIRRVKNLQKPQVELQTTSPIRIHQPLLCNRFTSNRSNSFRRTEIWCWPRVEISGPLTLADSSAVTPITKSCLQIAKVDLHRKPGSSKFSKRRVILLFWVWVGVEE